MQPKSTFEVERANVRQRDTRGWIVVEFGPRDEEGRRYERVTSWKIYTTKKAAQTRADELTAARVTI